MAKKIAYPVRGDVVESLRLSRAMTLETLAGKVDVHVKTLRRILNGGNAHLATIQSIAKALATTPDSLRADIPREPVAAATRFSLELSIEGEVDDGDKLAFIVQITPKVIAMLAEHGITMSTHTTDLRLTEYSGDEAMRTLVLIYGMLASRKPFWAFAAVMSYKYSLFLKDHKSGVIDITNFSQYGEIIVCDEGISPSDEVTLEVAKIYQAESEAFLRKVHEDIERCLPFITDALNGKERQAGLLHICKQLQRPFLGRIYPRSSTTFGAKPSQ